MGSRSKKHGWSEGQVPQRVLRLECMGPSQFALFLGFSEEYSLKEALLVMLVIQRLS